MCILELSEVMSWSLFRLFALLTYLLGYFLTWKYVKIFASWFKGCSIRGVIHISYGIVLALSSIPALMYIFTRYTWLLELPTFSLYGLIVFSLTILLLAFSTFLWEWRISGTTSIDYCFLEAIYCKKKLTLFLTYVSGPIFEEVVYRGLIQYTLSNIINPWIALTITTLAFTVPHIRILGTKSIPIILIVSLTLGLLLIAYNSLIPPILAHTVVNIAGSIRRLKTIS